ncbi:PLASMODESMATA CALLOSE-BINDING PROTEIN 3-like isoform X2 [Phoenix dactylifera]|uniref:PLASMODESMATA CALLOSE-BINDING PROTEIN 3-like isoform X2 n=1 Tax=Phoenix dactylifera TaxID=42345 RepID=A0A8B7D0C7_PHODC|nr:PLASMODESMATA CALLOSE-BINDING PROTEIN 3-like isoform X2 [Phoenix dactylifera]
MGGAAVGILVVVGLMMVLVARRAVEGATWCIARSSASATALQTALDFACGAGADCLPIQASGLCYLPNTLPAHASYAFNSYYQRSNAAPGSCDFAGTATVSVTDPSYGSCTYPSSKRGLNIQHSQLQYSDEHTDKCTYWWHRWWYWWAESPRVRHDGA